MASPSRKLMDDWIADWAPLVALVGRDLSDGSVVWSANIVEPGDIRRYLERLEFDCALHDDRDVARLRGYRDVTAPYTSLGSFELPVRWRPEDPLGTTPALRDVRLAHSAPRWPRRPAIMPPVTAWFATDYEADYLQPVVAGDRVGRVGNRLLRCEPKETPVGYGAFTTWEYQVINQREETVAFVRFGMYYYNPFPRQGGAASHRKRGA